MIETWRRLEQVLKNSIASGWNESSTAFSPSLIFKSGKTEIEASR